MLQDFQGISRRHCLILAAAAARLEASPDDFWNRKATEAWTAGDVYQLMNHSPWANHADWWCPNVPGRNVVKGVVTWESAPPIRDALKTPSAPVYANYYVIGVDGFPPGVLSANSMCRYAKLRSTGKLKWSVGAASARELIRTSAVYEFAFPRSAAPIGPDTGDVNFEISFGDWFLQSRFKPKDMQYRGKLAL